MTKLAIVSAVSAFALMGFALAANAHPDFDCHARESGSYLSGAGGAGAEGADLVISHGKATELGKTASQGAFLWEFDAEACDEGGLALVEGYSVTRAANGSLVFVDYTPVDETEFGGTNCANEDGFTATADVFGRVTGGTGNFEETDEQEVHTINIIFPFGFGSSFGGVTTTSHNECLAEED